MSDADFDGTSVGEPVGFDEFGCNPYAKNPDTPDFLKPDVENTRQFYGFDLDLPGGEEIEIWSFRDPDARKGKTWPGPAIRVTAGQIVHTKVKANKGTHTIHLHGMDPTTFNDGVGHTSFEVNGNYIYQYQPMNPGTYFYHCHKNTTLHFEMGMYGLLLVDPVEGPGYALRAGVPVKYDVEANWVPDDLDPVWHELHHNAGLCGEDVGLNDFNPKYFVISGVPNNRTMKSRKVRVDATLGDKILVRVLAAAYGVTQVKIGLDAEVINVDGRVLGGPLAPWSQPFTIPADETFELTGAQRYDMLIDANEVGDFNVKFTFLDWIRRQVQANGAGVAETRIRVKA
ncbi:MAG: multicopper oxidase domain-containing protein [Rhodobacteraceae bacterium]|nr:multicopper oxidase domain-containing protein [Paracoccaceae bacterium]